MEEGGGPTVKMTRLRRRLSVEAEDVKSPSTPSTPTKKRGGRLAAKPQLELIDEHAGENVPKRSTRKSIARDIVDDVEEKLQTPSRRSARIRSNTSIVSDTPQNINSPRAKRAARRISQAGSDNEGPSTPARQTRRTRKDSTSSLDKVDVVASNKISPVTEVIVEVLEKETKDSENSNRETPSKTTPRLKKNSGRRSGSSKPDNTDNNQTQENKTLNTSINQDKSNPLNNSRSSKLDDTDNSQIQESKTLHTSINQNKSNPLNNSGSCKPDDIDNNQTQENKTLNTSINHDKSNPLNYSSSSKPDDTDNNQTQKNKTLNSSDKPEEIVKESNLSITSYNLIKELDTNSKKTDNKQINKSLSSIEVQNNLKNKRHRTKSWTTITNSSSIDASFSSDTEITKKKKFNKNKSSSLANTSSDGVMSSGEAYENTRADRARQNYEKNASLLLNTSKRANESTTIIEKHSTNISASEKPNDSFKSITNTTKDLNHSNESNKENITALNSQEINDSKISEKLFKEAPSGQIQLLVYIEDSDSNAGSTGKPSTEKENNEDQCVPVVEHQSIYQATPSTHNDSCEPMDIDETMPANISISDFQNKSSNSKRKSSLSIPQDNETSSNKSNNESKRKSMSISESQNLEKSGNENKSTLILSQIKDLSSNDLTSKSPKVTINEDLKFVKLPDTNTHEKKQSQNYLTSTPLQLKSIKKLGLPLNTSIISSQETKNISPSNNSNSTKAENSESSEENSESDEIEAKEKSGMFDDEAEEASDDYQSGDSRDEDERQYEEENEIKERGETLDSDEDLSNDTDYEKDSFVVSSDEEDNKLLSGSGDDLSSNDNELTMSAKSKMKFNKRTEKEQKKASKEMYEARHKINNFERSLKSETPKPKKNNRMRLDSTLLDSDNEDVTVPSQKNNRLRIDSSQDISTKSETDKSLSRKKKRAQRLSESLDNESIMNEKEITMNNEITLDEKNDPLLIQLKQEPKTPQKNLDMSTVMITNGEEVEEVNVDENDVTIMKMNETSDPLHGTIANSDDSSSSSDNAEIIKNYDSMLNELNNDVKKKREKLWDTSLNLNKKSKSKSNAPIVDQLNLTITKKSTKSKKNSEDVMIESQDIKDTTTTSKPILNNIDKDSSSDSIDMRLLFPEDSNDSEFACDMNKDKQNKDADEIPLKRTEGKTDITECFDTSIETKEQSELNMSKKKDKKRKSSLYLPKEIESNEASESTEESVLNVSKKKEKNRKSSLCQQEEVHLSSDESAFCGFYVDTTGAGFDTDPSTDTTVKSSAKKKKNKNKNHSTSSVKDLGTEDNETVEDCTNEIVHSEKKRKSKQALDSSQIISDLETAKTVDKSDDEAPQEVSFKCKNKKILDISQTIENKTAEADNTAVNTHHKKKKSKQSLDRSQIIVDSQTDITVEESNDDALQEVSYQSKKKKNKTILDISKTTENETAVTDNTVVNTQHKKKSKLSLDSSQILVDSQTDLTAEESNDNAPQEISYESKKKKNKKIVDISQTTENETAETDDSHGNTPHKKKKSKQSLDSSQIIVDSQTDITDTVPAVLTSQKDKKMKNKKHSEMAQSDTEVQIEEKEKSINKSKTSSEKKKKKKDSITEIFENPETVKPVIEVIHSPQNKILDQKTTDIAVDVITYNKDDELLSHEEETSSKKRKRKSSGEPKEGDISNESKTLNESLTVNKKNKKRKTTCNDEIATAQFEGNATVKKSKKNKHSRDQENIIQSAAPDNDVSKKSRKRKERDDDSGSKVSKVFKENSFDKVHVPRLPASILNQIDDKPKKVVIKKTKPISTTQFVVEESIKKKNKPSNYLEESVYLNESPIAVKQKASLKKPKVLPFIPTASTSANGFTTNFRVNQIPRETQFIAQSSNIPNFKDDYLQNRRIKKLGTYELYKKGRNVKLSKY